MKFHDPTSVNLFLIEIGQPILDDPSIDFKPTDEMLEFFFKKRSGLVRRLIDHRKSQMLKAAWKKNRWKFMKGIQKFHHSTAGKRFHRQLGDFLARNDFSHGFLKKPNESLIDGNIGAALKAISSARTHAYIETEFYCSVDEHADYIIFLEEFMEATFELERKIHTLHELTEEDIDTLMNIIGKSNLIHELSVKHSIDDTNTIDSVWGGFYSPDKPNSMYECFRQTDAELVKK